MRSFRAVDPASPYLSRSQPAGLDALQHAPAVRVELAVERRHVAALVILDGHQAANAAPGRSRPFLAGSPPHLLPGTTDCRSLGAACL